MVVGKLLSFGGELLYVTREAPHPEALSSPHHQDNGKYVQNILLLTRVLRQDFSNQSVYL